MGMFGAIRSAEPKFHIGDRVRIRTYDDLMGEFGSVTKLWMPHNLKEHCGDEYTIDSYSFWGDVGDVLYNFQGVDEGVWWLQPGVDEQLIESVPEHINESTIPEPNIRCGSVRIREWDDMAAEYGIDSLGNINLPIVFTPSMRKFCGARFAIRKIYYDHDLQTYIYELHNNGTAYPQDGDDFDENFKRFLSFRCDGQKFSEEMFEDVYTPLTVDSEPKYHSGDKVRVREWDDMAREYGVCYGGIETPEWFRPEMKVFCGKELTVLSSKNLISHHIHTFIYEFVEDGSHINQYPFAEETLEPVISNYAEEDSIETPNLNK